MGILRLLLALSVLEFHSVVAFGNAPIWPFGLPNGVIAVQSFYVISGFYMSLVLSDPRKYAGKPWRVFYCARLLRLLPMYWIVLIATIAAAPQISLSLVKLLADQPLLGLWTWFTNIALIGQDWNSFFSPVVHNIVSPAWTLGVELTFYALAPVLVRLRSVFLLGILSLSVAARLLAYSWGFDYDPWSYRFFPFELAWFLAGMIAHRVYIIGSRLNSDAMRFMGACAFTLVVASMVHYAAIWYQPGMLPFDFLRGDGQAVKFIVPLVLPFIFALTQKSKIDSLIGEFSYPVYLSHFLVLQLIAAAGYANGFLALVCSVFSAALLLLITAPIERRRSHPSVAPAE